LNEVCEGGHGLLGMERASRDDGEDSRHRRRNHETRAPRTAPPPLGHGLGREGDATVLRNVVSYGRKREIKAINRLFS
jgi:hypothetical protein